MNIENDQYKIVDGVLVKANNKLESFIIPEVVTKIGSYAFRDCKLANIELPSSVKEIKEGAFYGCDLLKKINLPSDLLLLHANAFANCSLIENIEVPSGILKIKNSTFFNCTSLKSVNLNENLIYIYEHAFEKCSSLEEITIPSNVLDIGKFAFQDCISLKKVNLNEGLSEMEYGAFRGCSRLMEITVPSTIKKLDGYTFDECSSLKKVNFNEGLVKIDEGVFFKCSSLEEIMLPSTTKTIGKFAFGECLLLKKVKFNEGLEEIGEHGFQKCESLEEIIIPNGIKKIGDGAFSACASLKKVILPGKLKKVLGNGVFSKCNLLKKIYINNKCNIILGENSITIEYLDIKFLNIYAIYKIIEMFNIENIILRSPRFSFLKKEEKESIKLLIDKGYKISYVKDKSVKVEDILNESKNEDDIESIKSEIIYMSKEFPEDIRNVIIKNVNDIYNSYKNSINSFKPKYGEDNGNLFDYENLKIDTYMALFRIKNILNENKEFVKFITEINEYKKINDVSSSSPKNSIKDKICNIIYFSSFLNNNNEYRNIVFSCLDNALNTANECLIDKLNGNMVFMDISTLKRELVNRLYEVLKEVVKKVKRIPKFKLTYLYDLIVGRVGIKLKFNGIIEDISTIIEVIDKLSDSEYKDRLKKDLDTIFNNNKGIIYNALNGEVTEEVFNNIELKLRGELNSLIEELDKYAKLDEYEDKEINIYRQIDISYELINGVRYLDDELSSYSHNDVLLEVINIIKVVEKKGFDKEIREKVYSDVSNVLTAIKSILNVTDISTKDKYIKFIAVATSLFNDVNSNIDKYIKNTNEYNSSFNIKK